MEREREGGGGLFFAHFIRNKSYSLWPGQMGDVLNMPAGFLSGDVHRPSRNINLFIFDLTLSDRSLWFFEIILQGEKWGEW